MFCSVVIVAAGSGKRMNLEISKQFINIHDKPILAHTIEKFESCSKIDEIILVLSKDNIDYCKDDIVYKYNFKKVSKYIIGKDERQFSVYEGIKAVSSDTDIILVHDGVRPFVKIKDIEKVISNANLNGAATLGVKTRNTIKICNSSNKVVNTPNRNFVWEIQTPQAFKRNLILEAHKSALHNNFFGTDDAMLVEALGQEITVVEGSYSNIKITTIEDIFLANAIFNKNN